MSTRPEVTVVSIEPGFAEIMCGGCVVGVADADFWMRWTVRLFTAPGARNTRAVPEYALPRLRDVRADVRRRLAGDGPWWESP
jgi:hypothetical protein